MPSKGCLNAFLIFVSADSIAAVLTDRIGSRSDPHTTGLTLRRSIRSDTITCIAGARLVDMVVAPHALVEAGGKLRLHAVYYITKQIIPALERVLNLVGADPRSWFVGMTKPQRLLPQKRPPTALPLTDMAKPGGGIGTIDQYYLSRHCAVGSSLTLLI